jgi:hypothetical protein
MSSDPLPLPEIWSDLPDGGAYEGTRTEFVANGRSGLVLVEYATGFAQSDSSDPQPVARVPIQRAGQPRASGPLASLAPAALAKGLADLTAIVTQAEALLRAQGALKGDVHFAVERIADVAMALRMRDVDSALCDTLDASVGEVGDAVVRHEAAATGALSAAALLRDVVRRLQDLAVVASRMIAADAAPLVRQPAAEAEVSVEAVAPVATQAGAAIETPAPLAAEMEATIETPAPVATETNAAIESLASVASEPDAAIETSAPVVAEMEATIETPAPVAMETAAIESLASVASEPDVAIETPAPVVAEAQVTIDAFAPVATGAPLGGEVLVQEAAARPEAETLHHSAADAPMARPVDIAIPDDDHARSLRDAASDTVMVGDDGPRRRQSLNPTTLSLRRSNRPRG